MFIFKFFLHRGETMTFQSALPFLIGF